MHERKPEWLRVRAGGGARWSQLHDLVRRNGLHTVCEEALCPNMGRCWQHGRLTLMILGGVCTRGCGFCNVSPGRPAALDAAEPERVADALRALGLREVVLTSVTRDDLADGGAEIWAETIARARAAVPGLTIEALVPDFGGSRQALDRVLRAEPDVLAHNLETVPSLYGTVRPQAIYRRSLDLLRRGADAGLPTKTGIMVGLGETEAEIHSVMREARNAGCSIFFIGQYLRPGPRNIPVRRYVEPVEFDRYRDLGLQLGFKVVVSAPLVRSSYHSEEQARFLEGPLKARAPGRMEGRAR